MKLDRYKNFIFKLFQPYDQRRIMNRTVDVSNISVEHYVIEINISLLWIKSNCQPKVLN